MYQSIHLSIYIYPYINISMYPCIYIYIHKGRNVATRMRGSEAKTIKHIVIHLDISITVNLYLVIKLINIYI